MLELTIFLGWILFAGIIVSIVIWFIGTIIWLVVQLINIQKSWR